MLEAARKGPLRNRLMLGLAYDAELRREELCSLGTGDLDPANRLLHIRAETTKGRRSRVLPYSVPTGALLAAYLAHRRTLTRERGKANLLRLRQDIPLNDDELKAVDGDIVAQNELVAKLSHVPTPDGPVPQQANAAPQNSPGLNT